MSRARSKHKAKMATVVGGRGRRDRHKRKPRLESLESRELLSITSFQGDSRPKILYPANTKWVPITITGGATITPTKSVPQFNFQVVDEYRLNQPSGLIKARKVEGVPGLYTFTVKIRLQASVRAQDISGRQYFITVAARDNQGSLGQVFPVLVPNPKWGPPPSMRASGQLAHRLQARGR